MAKWITGDGNLTVETVQTVDKRSEVIIRRWSSVGWVVWATLCPTLGSLTRELHQYLDPADLTELPSDNDTSWEAEASRQPAFM